MIFLSYIRFRAKILSERGVLKFPEHKIKKQLIHHIKKIHHALSSAWFSI